MKKLYTRFIGWLIAPAIQPLHDEVASLRLSLGAAQARIQELSISRNL